MSSKEASHPLIKLLCTEHGTTSDSRITVIIIFDETHAWFQTDGHKIGDVIGIHRNEHLASTQEEPNSGADYARPWVRRLADQGWL
jgi:hypothetical protein